MIISADQYFCSLLIVTAIKDISKKLIALHARKKSKVTALKMFSKSLTNRRNQALLRRKEIIKELPDLSVILDFPAKLMGKKKYFREKYILLEEL